jgi:hypothetical protein
MKLDKLPAIIAIELVLGILAIVFSVRSQSALEIYVLIPFVLIPFLIVYFLLKKAKA